MRVSAWWLVAAALLGFSVGLGSGRVRPVHLAPSRGAPVAIDAERWSAVEARLEALQRSLELRSPRVPSPIVDGSPASRPAHDRPEAHGTPGEPASPASVPTPATGGDQAQVLAALAALESDLRAELEGLRLLLTEREAPEERLERLREEGRDIDWVALEGLVSTWRRDAAAAEKEVELLTTASVLERFGPPTKVWTNTNGIHWQYTSGVPGDWEVILRIPDGYVTNLIIR